MTDPLSWLKEALFPIKCARCNQQGTHLCEVCLPYLLASLTFLSCPMCEKENRIGMRCQNCDGALDGLITSVPYANPMVSELIGRWKFEFARSVEPTWVHLIQRSRIEELLGPGEWTVIPVSLHTRRERERGFDQAAWIAKTVADHLEAPSAPVLERRWYTKPRARVGREERLRDDYQNLFSCKTELDGPVLLCDDVYTSGATMEAAAQACKNAGATSVWGYAIARG